MRRRRPLATLGPLLVLAALAVACAQAPATTNFGDPEGTGGVVGSSGSNVVLPTGPTLDTIPVWLREHGILLWKPAVGVAGTYAFEIENIGDQPHDFIIVQVPSIERIPIRSDRAILHDLKVVARSPLLQPEQTTTMLANLEQSGAYVVLSSHDRDFGLGMASILTVGDAPTGRVDPLPTPPPDDGETVAVFMVDDAMFLHTNAVNSGIVTFNVQNIGPSPHDFVVLRWRGDPTALPVDEAGEVLMDGLIVMDRLDTLASGEAAVLEVELEQDFAYVVLSSLPGDYAKGMGAQVVPR